MRINSFSNAIARLDCNSYNKSVGSSLLQALILILSTELLFAEKVSISW